MLLWSLNLMIDRWAQSLYLLFLSDKGLKSRGYPSWVSQILCWALCIKILELLHISMKWRVTNLVLRPNKSLPTIKILLRNLLEDWMKDSEIHPTWKPLSGEREILLHWGPMHLIQESTVLLLWLHPKCCGTDIHMLGMDFIAWDKSLFLIWRTSMRRGMLSQGWEIRYMPTKGWRFQTGMETFWGLPIKCEWYLQKVFKFNAQFYDYFLLE